MNYGEFLEKKTQLSGSFGFDVVKTYDAMFDFQKFLTEWALKKGRAAIFADCGLGKTVMQLAWADNIVKKTNKAILIFTPLAVGAQTVREGNKFGIDCNMSRDGKIGPSGIYITNYEKLHLFDPNSVIGVVCDESSILKHFSGATQKGVTRFLSKLPYRLLCTATAAPNDYTELGTSSEALGELGYSDVLSRFFVMDDKKRYRMNDAKLARAMHSGGNYFQKLSYRVAQQIGAWRLKGHAEIPFWKWVCSWARACRMPSDLGFCDDEFVLPQLIERDHIIEPKTPPDGMLFTVPAFGLGEEREERRRTLNQRCEFVAQLVAHKKPAVVWCHYNAEGDLLEKLIPDCVQVKGSQSDDQKEEAYKSFGDGSVRIMITKPKIGAWGLNWQHCAHVITFATHSYEQYYQAVRRCWRFGQKSPVTVDIIATQGESRVRENMVRKSEAAAKMFTELVKHMRDATYLSTEEYEKAVEVPRWL